MHHKTVFKKQKKQKIHHILRLETTTPAQGQGLGLGSQLLAQKEWPKSVAEFESHPKHNFLTKRSMGYITNVLRLTISFLNQLINIPQKQQQSNNKHYFC